MRNVFSVLIVLSLLLGSAAEAKIIRATEMNGSLWTRLMVGSAEELIVEFRQGDELPVSFSAQGDLIETSRTGVSYVSVKKNFWLKLESNNVQMSLDGTVFKPIEETITGSFTAGAGSGDNGEVANAISFGLRANTK